MIAVITGASGLLGGNLAVELVKAGHTVRATRRAGSPVKQLASFPIEWVEAELGDKAALARAFAGAQAVFHCAAQVSILRKATPALVRANVDGTRNVLAAVREAGVGRLVHCSTVGAVGLSEDGKPSTESARWNFAERGMADGYVTTKRAAEELVHAAVAGGADAVIANPTYLIGPLDARPSSGKLVQSIVLGTLPGLTPGFNNFADARDVARGLILLHEKGRRGERYILGGENLSYPEFARRVASIAGVKAPTRNVPRAFARLLGFAGDLQESLLGREPFVNSVRVGYGFCDSFIFSSEKARAELGYVISPLDDAIRDCIAWFREQGMLPPAPEG